MAEETRPAIHSTAVSIDGHGVLIAGPSGSGKSDLALRLLDRGAVLIADDYVILEDGVDAPLLRQPPNIAGKLEVREIGIVDVPCVDDIPARLYVELGEAGERLPETLPFTIVDGHELPLLQINPFHASAPIKVELALKSVVDRYPPMVPLTDV